MEIMAQHTMEGNIIIKNTFVRKIINGDALKYMNDVLSFKRQFK